MKRNYDEEDAGNDRNPESPSPEDQTSDYLQFEEDVKKETPAEKISNLEVVLEDLYKDNPGSDRWTKDYMYSDRNDEVRVNSMNDVERSELLAKRHDVLNNIISFKKLIREAQEELKRLEPPPKKSKKSERTSSSKSSKPLKKPSYHESEEEEEEEEEEHEDDDYSGVEEDKDEDEEDEDDDDGEGDSKKKRSKKSRKSKKEKKKKEKKRKEKEKDIARRREKESQHSDASGSEPEKDYRTPSPEPEKEDGNEEETSKKSKSAQSYPIVFKDIKWLQLRRSNIVDYMLRPGFKTAAVGFFVRSRCTTTTITSSSSTTSTSAAAAVAAAVSKMSKIIGVSQGDEYTYDRARGRKTNVYLLIRSPDEAQARKLQVQYVSEQAIEKPEFESYCTAAEQAGEPVITKSVRQMYSDYRKEVNRSLTAEEITNLRRNPNNSDIYLRRDALSRSLTTLRGNNSDGANDKRIAEVVAELRAVHRQIEAYERKKREEKLKLEKASASAAAALTHRDIHLKAYRKALAAHMAANSSAPAPRPAHSRADLVKDVIAGKPSADGIRKCYDFPLDLNAPLKLNQPTLAYPVPPLSSDVKVITLADYVSTHH